MIAAWWYTWLKMNSSPLQSAELWKYFLTARSTIQLFAGPIMLPIQAIATLFLVDKYRNFVIQFEKKLPTFQNFPILNRCLSLFLTYLMGNLITTAAIASLGCFSVSSLYRSLQS